MHVNDLSQMSMNVNLVWIAVMRIQIALILKEALNAGVMMATREMG